MMEQFFTIKRQYPETILFYRMGDFYEMFFDDALKAAEILDITLTQRGLHRGQPVPMCGVPVHSADSYLRRLIASGCQVTICEQTESPEEAKKRGGSKALVERQAVRMVTAGTLVEDELLESDRANRLACLAMIRDEWALAWLELSQGRLFSQKVTPEQLSALLAEIEPSEVLIEETLPKNHRLELVNALPTQNVQMSTIPRGQFSHALCTEKLDHVFSVSREKALSPVEEVAVAVIINYIERTQIGKLPNLQPPNSRKKLHYVTIDAATRRNLEMVRTLSGEKKGSLLQTIDRCITSSGKRLFTEYLTSPLVDCGQINERLDRVTSLVEQGTARRDLREKIRNFPDLERPLSRIELGLDAPKDILSIKVALEKIVYIQNYIKKSSLGSLIQNDWQGLTCPLKLLKTLDDALALEMPKRLSDGGVIKEGYDDTLDYHRSLRDNARRLMMKLQVQLQKETGVSTLKIKFNNMLGHFIEVSDKSSEQLDQVRFIHRQSLKNVARFTTTELIELARDIQQAGINAQLREDELYAELRESVLQEHTTLKKAARLTAKLDVFAALAHLAVEERYVRPTLHTDTRFQIVGGRHPVVEKNLHELPYAQNDCILEDEQRLWLLSGPNMAGKSTFLRQNALIVIMAQMGSYVPAHKADIGLVDQLFSRVGAADDLARGHSTFMVEMMECATILRNASKRSFVILDEIGRGTATFDGLSIAWACVEYLHNSNGSRTIFATHYHELAEALEDKLPHLSSFHMKVKEWQGEVVFLYQVEQGRAEGSYGIHVARLAGLPAEAIQRAETVLHSLEKTEHDFDIPEANSSSVSALNPQEKAALSQIQALDVDALSARDALDVLYSLKQQLRDKP